MSARHRNRVLGAPIDLLDMRETLAAVVTHVENGVPGAHLGVNAANLIMAREEPGYLADLDEADLVTADGQSVVWGARLRGLRVPARVAGIDLMLALLDESRRRGWSVFLLGARPSVVAALADRLARDGIRVAGHRDGYLDAASWPGAVAAVRASGARLLFVGMPSPAKERLIIGFARPGGIPFSVGVGGSFDVLSGERRRAPGWVQRIGLEWLARLVQEPRRLAGRYVLTNTRFLWLLASDAVLGRGRRRRR